MLAQNVLGVRSATKHLNRFVLFTLGRCYASGSRLHLQIEMVLKIVELGILRRVA